jgi:hypothetical protein
MKNEILKTVFQLSIVAVVGLLMITPEAQAAQTSIITTLTGSQSKLIPGITAGFALFAAVKWIEYFANFSTSSALTNAIVPAMLTFLTFQWESILKLLLGS